MVRKKPVCIVKNAHPLLAAHKEVEQNDGDRIPNGHIGKFIQNILSFSGFKLYAVNTFRPSQLCSNGMVLNSVVQKMETTLLKATIVHQQILGLVQSLFVVAVTLLHQELVTALFDYGLLKVKAK